MRRPDEGVGVRTKMGKGNVCDLNSVERMQWQVESEGDCHRTLTHRLFDVPPHA